MESNKIAREKIIADVYGITSTIRKSIGGVTSTPQNSIFITNRRIMIVVINFPASNVEGISYLGGVFLRKKIAEKGKKMIKSWSPEKILKSDPKNISIPFSDIDHIKISKYLFGFIPLPRRKLKIYTKKGKKYAYLIYNKDDFEKLNKILPKYSKIE